MSLYTLSGPLGQGKAVSTAGGGTALTTSAATVLLPFGTRQIDLSPRLFAGAAEVARFTKVPWLTVLKTTDLLAAIANMTDYSRNAQDGSTSTDVTLSGLDTLVNGDALYVGSFEPFLGVVVDVDAANSNASVLTVEYRKSDDTWASITPTDGTDNAGAAFGQDGNVTWSEPSDWIARGLADIVTTADPRLGSLFRIPQFWTRWTVSAALDASSTLNSMVAMPRTTYAEIPAGMGWQEAVICGPAAGPSIAGISALVDADTASLVINAFARNGGYIPS